MDFTTLGRTGLRVSRLGLGAGGHSRLGLSYGRSEVDAEAVVRAALDLGVNFFDTAEGYRTEEVVGRGLRDVPRHQIVISTKAGVGWQERRSTPDEYRNRIDACLERLQTDYIDIFHIHGARVEDYDYARDALVPVLKDSQRQGKIRFVGVTEAFGPDPTHEMLKLAVRDDCWDVVMVGFNILNQSAREIALKPYLERSVGMLCMFAVRRALSHPAALSDLMSKLAAEGLIDPKSFNPEDPLGFLVKEGGASSVTEAAYRFCRWEPGLDVILTGTGSIDHLRENARAINLPPLPTEIVDRLRAMFRGIDSVSGN
ncbi:aldo/keto reductase [Fimbriimonas ginsengisoli]|uniref:Aldo/keto reductase n=1 Tax=Fimbriimonas ginsengisoli Gsoil 348 TaxID=661478 RepID=A0A068NU06_FIMGI|nr:aldo/keto reductase [Fimbriimonas ginsengisoli]AIE86926.1 aldo/keto reductase [Fimbriimonas ginsengisoli Gsoil 348]